jgi:hypothetical protein
MLQLSLRMLLRRGLGNYSSACGHNAGCLSVSRTLITGRPLPLVRHSLWTLQQPPAATLPTARAWAAARHRSGPSTDNMVENGNQAALKRPREAPGTPLPSNCCSSRTPQLAARHMHQRTPAPCLQKLRMQLLRTANAARGSGARTTSRWEHGQAGGTVCLPCLLSSAGTR